MNNLLGNGVLIGEVTDLEDPLKLGRIRVKFPALKDQLSDWSPLVTGMAGPDRGLFLRPEVGDHVLVAFEQGSPRRSYILGSVWSQKNKPPADDGNAKDNNWRFLRSRSGHLIKIDDTKGKEKVEIVDMSSKHRVVIDTSKKKIQIEVDDGEVEIRAKNKALIDAKEVEISAQKISAKSKGPIELVASGTMTIKGKTIQLN